MASKSLAQVPGSFRDPAGKVYVFGNQILRTVSEIARSDYSKLRDNGVLSKAVEAGYLCEFKELEKDQWPFKDSTIAYVLEHPRIPYISYPYEWSFHQLKAAALHHLDFQLFLLENDAVLSDATAYNVQFVGSKPIFIDLLSIRPYKKGEFWGGYRQFCEQFLNPLLLRSVVGISHNAWFRGSMQGITTIDLAKLIPKTKRFSLNMLTQVMLKAKLDKKAIHSPDSAVQRAKSCRELSKTAYRGLLTQLRNWISKLTPADKGKTIWGDYADVNTYSSQGVDEKHQFVSDFVAKVKPKILVDLGCNTGNYSVSALSSGAEYVVGFDFDQQAVDLGFSRAQKLNLPFLSLYFDASNPSPDQGWMQTERQGFDSRTKVDALIALAFEHHLAIAQNIPLKQVVEWLINIAPQGIIEFVPKSDPTVQKMLAVREDIFPDYHVEEFEKQIKSRAKIVKKQIVPDSDRCLFWYERTKA